MEEELDMLIDNQAVDRIEASIYKKMVVRILPIVMLGMFISYIDRANLGIVAGPMSDDLGLTAAAFGLAAGLFYIGYLLFEIPSNMALAKFGARVWIARIMISWGAVTVLMATVQNEFMLNALRMLLGLAEAGFSPGVLLYLAFWFPPRLLPRAYSMLNLAVPIALMIGAVLTSTLLLLDGVFGLAGWRWVFILEGLPAIVLAAYIFLKLPDKPDQAVWLTSEEKNYLATTATQSADANHGVGQMLSVLRRPSVWVFAATYFCVLIGFWSITYFLPTIIGEQFDVGPVGAGFISAIPWLFSAVIMFVVVRSVARTGDRTWHMTGLMVAAGSGLAVGVLSGNAFITMCGVSLAAAGFFGVLSTFQATVSQVYAGGIAVVAIAVVNSFGNLSGLVGPYVLGTIKDATGSTESGLLIMAGFFGVAAVLIFIMSRWADHKTGGINALASRPGALDTDDVERADTSSGVHAAHSAD
ncbi:nitrate/nitrite transporter NarK [Rhodococcus rhodochrous J45]|uniref:Nitrate/nitrite transporter NarK n=2 Tax=Rhodococcus rhodochrous TaxID=1829 RepID=A0A562DMU7_RHORH|nr:nitrate/nitrite transporter NarK [Rhodococcus rhodochrous J45]